MAKKRDIEM